MTHPTPRSRTRRPGLRIVALAAAAALALSGCSIQLTSRPDPSIGDDTMLIGADSGSPMFQRNFNPYLANKRIGATYIYEPLIYMNVLDGELTPWLAESWDLPDATTIVLTIRDGATWSDGEPLTADDVAFTFDMIKEFPPLDIKGAWSHMQGYEVDGNRVTITLNGTDVPALQVIGQTQIVPEHIWKDQQHPDTWRNENPVGSGPFTLGNYYPQQYTLDRNPDYWQADAVEVEHIVMPASNTQLDVATKGYDWAYAFISDVEHTWGAANADNKWWFPAGGVISLIPNLEKAPFDDVNVRRGIALALDRDKIAEVASEGYTEAAGQTGLLLPNQQDVLDPDIPNQGLIAQDTDAALDAFAEAGYTQQGDQLVGPDGAQLTFSILTANGYTDWQRAVQEVRDQLGAIGVDVQVTAPQPAGYQQALNNGDFDLAMGSMGTGDVYQAYNTLLSSSFYVPTGETTQSNFERFRSDDADRLLQEYQASIDPAEQTEILHELQGIVYDQLPVIGMYYGGLWGLFNTDKFTGWPSEDDPYASLQTWDGAPLLVFTRLKRADGGDGS